MTTPGQDAIQLAQISTKLDVLLAQHAATAGQVVDHEQRLRAVETKQTTGDAQMKNLAEGHADQEDRLRKADRWRYAMPISGAGAVGALLTGAAALIAVLGG